MPKLKPCPFCGAQPTLRENIYGSGEYLASINCPCINGDVAESYFLRSGETQKQATNKSIAAWNTRTESLPRALTWTTEPPKVPGWYLRRHNIAGRWSEADVMNFTRLSVKNSIIRSAMIQWAGPIPTPLEPGES